MKKYPYIYPLYIYIYTGVDDLLCRGLGGGSKRIATVVRFSKFFFCLKDTEKKSGATVFFFQFFDFLRL